MSRTERMADADVEEKLKMYPGWQRKDEKWLARKYRFPQYLEGIEFVRQAALAAEAMDHHPMISIDYKLVTVSVSTWSAGGISELDFELMKRCDELYARTSA